MSQQGASSGGGGGGGGVLNSLKGAVGTATPTAGAITILGSYVAASGLPVTTFGLGSNLNVYVQTAAAIAATGVTHIGLAAFNSAEFTVDANGFVSTSGTGIGRTITGNIGGALSPIAGNWSILGAGSISIAGSGNILTTQLTGLTNHNVILGAGTTSFGRAAPSATAGVPLVSNGAAADPSFSTALVAGGGTGSTTFSTKGVVISGATTTTALTAVSLTDGQLAIGSSSGNPTAGNLTPGTGISISNSSGSIVISSANGGSTWSDNSGSFAALIGNGYFITNTSTCTLPPAPSEGNSVSFIVDTSNILTVTANTGQMIRLGANISISGGTAVNSSIGDTIQLVYRSASTTWYATNNIGTWMIT